MKLALSQILLLILQGANVDDPGMPGGDPDLPETPLDSGVYLLMFVLLLYGFWRTRRLKAQSG